MLQRIQRPLSEPERRCLSRQLERRPGKAAFFRALGWFALWSGILVVCAMLFVNGLKNSSGHSGAWTAIMPVAFLVGIFSFYLAYLVASSYFHRARRGAQFRREDAPKLETALKDGQASVCRVVSESVIVIEEFEDEGSAYVYDLGDGTSFYLRGQEYYPEDERAPWPAREFEIVRTKQGGRLVAIFPGREPVPEVRMIPMTEMPESFALANEPKTETVLPGRPDEVVKRLGHQGGIQIS